jgi:hypothetical protein
MFELRVCPFSVGAEFRVGAVGLLATAITRRLPSRLDQQTSRDQCMRASTPNWTAPYRSSKPHTDLLIEHVSSACVGVDHPA